MRRKTHPVLSNTEGNPSAIWSTLPGMLEVVRTPFGPLLLEYGRPVLDLPAKALVDLMIAVEMERLDNRGLSDSQTEALATWSVFGPPVTLLSKLCTAP